MAKRLLIAILAAGASRRLGRAKQLVPLNGELLIHRQARLSLEAKCGEVVVILGAASTACAGAIVGLPVTSIFNPQWEEGLAASIRVATCAALERQADGLMIVQVDQYRLTAGDLARMALIWLNSDCEKSCRTRSGDYAGPPVILAKTCFANALQLTGDEGARRILQNLDRDEVIDVDLPNAIADLDLPANVEAMEAWLRAHAGA